MLQKWNIRVRATLPKDWFNPSISELMPAHLMSLIESQGIRKFSIHDDRKQSPSRTLLLWVFTPNVMFSSSLYRQGPIQGMKILFKEFLKPRSDLDSHDITMEAIDLPEDAIVHLLYSLRNSTEMLPPSASKVHEWEIGILRHSSPA